MPGFNSSALSRTLVLHATNQMLADCRSDLIEIDLGANAIPNVTPRLSFEAACHSALFHEVNRVRQPKQFDQSALLAVGISVTVTDFVEA